ncbi:MAG TPA: Gfo/Idh/MocA family oxidoreductase [Candidatus Limnocylindrales bacterium]|nr:Gfo/Idh/MocA family oxidoreductase [Candidatus Limnocylindrales bacterium]
MTLRVLLAGLGVRGRHWAEVLMRDPRTKIVAYADPNPAAVERTAAYYGVRPSFASLEAALENGPAVDAVVLANPPIGRESQVRTCAERGLPMLIEKPLALDVDEARTLVEIAEAANVPLMVGLNFRYLGVTIEAMRLLREGVVGRPAFARFTYERYRDGNRPDLNKYPLTMDQPMLWEQSIHHFDLLRYVYGVEPVAVECRTWNPPWSMYASDTNVAALFTFEGGLIVNYQGTWQSGWAEPAFEWRTDCTEGVLSQRHQFGDLFYARRFDAALTPVALPAHEQWITETSGLLEAFVAAIADGAPLPCSGRDHLASLAMVQACVLSSRQGQSVEIASFSARNLAT